MNRLKSYKAANCYSESSFFKNRPQQQQLASSSYQPTQSTVKHLISICLRSQFSAQLCWNWITFHFARSDVQLQWNPSLYLSSYKACNSLYFASRRWSSVKLWSELQKDSFFRWHCALHWWGEHRDLCRFFIVVLLSTMKLLQRSDRSTEDGITFPDPANNPRVFQVTIKNTFIL